MGKDREREDFVFGTFSEIAKREKEIKREIERGVMFLSGTVCILHYTWVGSEKEGKIEKKGRGIERVVWVIMFIYCITLERARESKKREKEGSFE